MCDCTRSQDRYSPVRNYLEALRRHAVDLPVELSVFVADLDREAAVVGPYQLDGLAELALDLELALLAGVQRPLAALQRRPFLLLVHELQRHRLVQAGRKWRLLVLLVALSAVQLCFGIIRWWWLGERLN